MTQQAIAATRATFPQLAGRTFTFGPVNDPNTVFTTNSSADAGGQLFGQLGMQVSPAEAALPSTSTPGRARIAIERLDLLEADVVILTYQSVDVRRQFEANPLFARLPAVRRGAYVALDLPAALSVAFPSVLSIPYGLGVIAPLLAAAVK